jgi:hypothetical protein
LSVTVRIVKDTGGRGLDDLARRLRAAAGKRALVGVPSGASEADDASMALVGATVEFGRPDVGQPERPFLRGGIRDAIPQVRAVAQHDLALVAEGHMSVGTVLDRLGAVGAGSVKTYMAGDHFAPNAPSTIAKKGSSQPTIDSAALRGSITHVVEDA